MPLTDWAARWGPVESYQPCRVWIPTQPVPAPPPADAARPPRDITLTLAPAEADHLPRHLPRVIEQSRPGRGDRVTVDLGSTARVHLTGLRLLLAVLWRRVGPDGAVSLTGGSPALRAQLSSLDLTSEQVRHDVLEKPIVVPAPRPEAPAPPLAVPQQRRADRVRLTLSGELDISNVAQNEARLDDLLATGVRDVEVDLTDVTFMDLRTLRVLLQADAQLRARGGRLWLLNPCRLVRRLLAITATQHLDVKITGDDGFRRKADAGPCSRVAFRQAQAA